MNTGHLLAAQPNDDSRHFLNLPLMKSGGDVISIFFFITGTLINYIAWSSGTLGRGFPDKRVDHPCDTRLC